MDRIGRGTPCAALTRSMPARCSATASAIVDRLALFADHGYRPIGVTSLNLPVGERFAWILAADDDASYRPFCEALVEVLAERRSQIIPWDDL